MKVKITQRGWQSYSGPLYGVEFVDGVAQSDISRQDALSIGAFVTVVEMDEDGNELGQVSPAVDMLRHRNVSAVSEQATSVAPVEPETPASTLTPATESKGYTQAELEAIASEKGISGLREIGEPLGVKNTAIKGLIREILAAQTSTRN